MTRGRTPIISANEYGPIDLPPGFDTVRTRDRLMAAGLRAGFQVFESRGRRLYAQGVVGVIDIGDVIVEILPKTSDGAPVSDNAAFLGNLLRFAGGDSKLTLALADIAVGDSGLLEVLLAWALRTVTANLRDGVPRRYVPLDEISTAIRGRVELRHLVRQRPGKAFELIVRHAPLHEDNLVNQIVRWLVSEVSRRTRSIRTRSSALQLLHALSSVRQIVPTLADLDRLYLSPLEDHWRPIIELTRTFLTQGEPDPARGGSLAAVAVLFTMHDLFEAALRRVLSEGLRSQGFSLQHNAGHLLLADGKKTGIIKLRPDFRIGLTGETSTRIVGDAKWKRIFDGRGTLNIRESDVYQLVTYIAALQADAGFIVCPLSDSEPDVFRRSTFSVLGVERPFDVWGVRVPVLVSETPEGGDLRKHFCDAVAAKLSSASSSLS